MWSQASENTAIITKPRIDDAGVYSLSNRFENGCVRFWFLGIPLPAGLYHLS